MNHTKRNRGFSIMETVIALVVIVLVTAAALSITMAAISARVKMSNYSEAQDFAHNVLECFKAADNNTEFESNMKDVAGYEYEDMSAEPSIYTYKVENKFEAEIIAAFDVDGDYFHITVNDSNGTEIISFTYQKG